MPGAQVGKLERSRAESQPSTASLLARRLWPAVVPGVVLVAIAMRSLNGPSEKRPADGPAAEPTPAGKAMWHDVTVSKPSGPPAFHTGVKDATGNPVTMACAACHKTTEPNPNARLATPMVFFHKDLKANHGNLACVACHNPADGYATLRLADGTPLPYTEVMQLCAQCHGPQYRDYAHGAHGGMTGHWDLSKGGRTRANCVDCHNPHAPKYPTVQPARGPNDRGVPKEAGRE
jgi:hypothetical protein